MRGHKWTVYFDMTTAYTEDGHEARSYNLGPLFLDYETHYS